MLNNHRAEFVLKNMKYMCLYYLIIKAEVAQVDEILLLKHNNPFIMHSQCHACCCPGKAESQDMIQM